MPLRGVDEYATFLSRLPARPADRRQALAVAAASCLGFALVAPFATVQLPVVWAFIPTYQSALVTNDLITAVLLYVQFSLLRTRALLVLAAGYLFTAAMAAVHALTFPGLFSETGLLGAGPQSTAWLYMFWHGGFPLVVIAYASLKDRESEAGKSADWHSPVFFSLLAVFVAVAAMTALATAGGVLLPPIMSGNKYTPAMAGVVTTVWLLSAAALVALYRRKPHSILDVWLMVVMVSWFFDIALAAVLNGGRFDLGFYAGRIYGLAAATFVLAVLLIETGVLYAQFARMFVQQRRRDVAEISNINTRLQILLESSPLPIISLDAKDEILTWNPAAERTFGYPAEEAVGKRYSQLQTGGTGFAVAKDELFSSKALRDARASWTHPDGRTLDIRYSAAPFNRTDAAEGVVIIAEDVTEKVKLERQLAQSQKMEAIGQLTGGIAHDFNNILTVITGTIDLLEEGLADRPPLAAIAKTIDDAAVRAAELTSRLLSFARRQSLQPQHTDLNVLVAETAKLLRPALGEQVEVECVQTKDAWPALIDPGQMANALINLAVNARDAMPDGGKVVIETGNATLDDAYAEANRDVKPGDYTMVAVSDSGSGIAPELLDKVLEPFFTTKEPGRGTGLGLSMVYGFTKQSGGHIKIYSEVGHGTTIKMYLPRASGTDHAVREVTSAPVVGGRETILVVEDDALLRSNLVMRLVSLGYRTLEVGTSSEALEAVRENEKIDLLFTDVVLRGRMTGIQLAEQATRLRPSLAILLTSGYTQRAIEHYGRLDPGLLLLNKPYRGTDLARMVRAALDQRSRHKALGTTAA